MADDYTQPQHQPPAKPVKVRVDRNRSLAVAAMNMATHAEMNANDFLAIASHDLRTPLSAMSGAAASIRDQVSLYQSDCHLQDWVDELVRSAESMERLVHDLEFGAFESGQMRLLHDHHDLAAIVHLAADTLRPLARAKSIVLSRDVGETIMVDGDGARILHVLLNLIDNAIKFTPAGGRIKVRLSRVEGTSVVTVVDTGVGIPKGKLSSIFAPLSQRDVDDPCRRGLGLYISRLIVEAHGGRLWAESEAGAGSTLFLTLPAA